MTLRDISNQKTWGAFVRCFPERTFLQSWEWGEFQRSLGHKIWRWGIMRGDTILGCALIIKIEARRGTHLLVPHGPLIVERDVESALPFFVREIRRVAQQERAGWLRINSLFPNNAISYSLFAKLGFRPAPLHVHPERTWVLNLEASEEKLFAGMRDTMRNLIRKGTRDQELGTRNYGNSKEALRKFWALYQATAKRQQFTPFDFPYIEKELAAFGEKAATFLAEYHPSTSLGVTLSSSKRRNEVLAGAFVVLDGESAFYHHGASVHSKISAAYVLQWEIIREAKRRGCSFYNFWGIAPEGKKNHPWTGLTLFKMGFGGEARDYLPTQDLVLRKSYWLNWLVETIRRIRRRY